MFCEEIMTERKRETFTYNGLGFPIVLVNAPLRKAYGEWIIDINFAQLQRLAMLAIAKKPIALMGKELRSIRHYLNMSMHELAKELGVSHVAIVHWENDERKMNAGTEIQLRLYLLNHLKVTDKEFRKTYNQFDRKALAKRHVESSPLEIDVEKIAC